MHMSFCIGLTSVTISNFLSREHTGGSETPVNLLPNLRKLKLFRYNVLRAPPYTPFQSENLNHLTILGFSFREFPDVAVADLSAFFSVVAPQLVYFETDFDLTSTILTLFSQCRQLSDLRITCSGSEFTSIASQLPSKLHTLAILYSKKDGLRENVLKAFHSALGVESIKGLKVVKFGEGFVSLVIWDVDRSKSRLFATLEKRGVAMEFEYRAK